MVRAPPVCDGRAPAEAFRPCKCSDSTLSDNPYLGQAPHNNSLQYLQAYNSLHRRLQRSAGALPYLTLKLQSARESDILKEVIKLLKMMKG